MGYPTIRLLRDPRDELGRIIDSECFFGQQNGACARPHRIDDFRLIGADQRVQAVPRQQIGGNGSIAAPWRQNQDPILHAIRARPAIPSHLPSMSCLPRKTSGHR